MSSPRPRKAVKSFFHRLVQMGATAGSTLLEMMGLREVLTKKVAKYKSLFAYYGTPPRKRKGVRDLDTGYRYRPKCIVGGNPVLMDAWIKRFGNASTVYMYHPDDVAR